MDIPGIFGGKKDAHLDDAELKSNVSDDKKAAPDDSGFKSTPPEDLMKDVVLGDPLADAATADNATSVSADDASSSDDTADDTATDSTSADDAEATVDAADLAAATNAAENLGSLGQPIIDESDNIVPNKTVTTNDESKVGALKPPEAPTFTPPAVAEALKLKKEGVKVPEPPKPEPEPIVPQPPVAPVVPIQPITPIAPEPEDPEKTDFIKTYTAEFDDAKNRATDAANKILDSIDAAVHDHSPDINIPDEANEFLDTPVDGGKVQKFEDARAIVRAVMARATEAKQQSEQAAAEASKIYDEVQNFKHETREQIAELSEGDIKSEDTKPAPTFNAPFPPKPTFGTPKVEPPKPDDAPKPPIVGAN
jgi:hypothetical protein